VPKPIVWLPLLIAIGSAVLRAMVPQRQSTYVVLPSLEDAWRPFIGMVLVASCTALFVMALNGATLSERKPHWALMLTSSLAVLAYFLCG
jgi:hypothetical protein